MGPITERQAMKKLITQGTFFLCTCALLYLAAFFILTHIKARGHALIHRTGDYYQWKGGVAWQKFAEWPVDRKWDALVVGSSHAYRGYDPRVFDEHGLAMFNLGSTAQTPLSSRVIVDEYVDATTTRLLIFDLYENAFNQAGNESVSDLTQNIGSDRAALELAWDFHDPRGLNLMTLRMLTKNEPPKYTDKNYVTRGFAVEPDSARGKRIRYDVGKPYRLDHRQLERFISLLDLCKKRGVPVVLTTHFYPHQSDRAKHAAFKTAINMAIAGRGLRWYDLAYAHGLSDEDHFVDHNHMNAAGARIFNERLLDSLQVGGYLPR